jgi:hypothetical protein
MAKMVPAKEHDKQLLEQQREAEGKVMVGERAEVAALKAQMAKMSKELAKMVPVEELAKQLLEQQREAEKKVMVGECAEIVALKAQIAKMVPTATPAPRPIRRRLPATPGTPKTTFSAATNPAPLMASPAAPLAISPSRGPAEEHAKQAGELDAVQSSSSA